MRQTHPDNQRDSAGADAEDLLLLEFPAGRGSRRGRSLRPDVLHVGDRTRLTRMEGPRWERHGELTIAAIRAVCRVRTQTVTRTLAALVESGRLLHTPAGYRLS